MNQIPFFAVAIMILLAALMFYGLMISKRRGIQAGKTISIFSGIAIVGIALYINIFRQDVTIKQMNERARKLQLTTRAIVAKTLVDKYQAQGRCLIVTPPTLESNKEYSEEIINGLKSGFGTRVTEYKAVTIKDYSKYNIEDQYLYEEFELKAADYNQLFEQNPGYDIVYIVAPLPVEKDELVKIKYFKMIQNAQSGEWERDPDIDYPLVAIEYAYISAVDFLFDESLIHTTFFWKPNAPVLSSSMGMEETFNKIYQLVTPDNIDEIRMTYPDLFPKDKENEN